MLHALENAPLADRVRDLPMLSNVLLLQHFHCVVFLSPFVLNEEHFPVGALTEHFQSCEVSYRCLHLLPTLCFIDHCLVALLEGFLFFLVRGESHWQLYVLGDDLSNWILLFFCHHNIVICP